MDKSTTNDTNEPSVRKYMVDILIPPACLDEDGGECQCYKKPEKKEVNPV